MIAAIGAALALLATSVSAISTITAKGSKLFTDDGNQFFIKGVAYQLVEDDPLAQTEQCQLDAALMKSLGANSIRVYHVDPTADHDGCMSAFSDAGIYAWIDLDTFSTYIIATQPEWTQTQFGAYQKVMDAFHNYDNVAGFFVGNEVLNTAANSVAAPYVKAAARDMKAYRSAQGYRDSLLVGYSAADIADLRPNLQNYLACGSNSSEAIDFFSLNAYEWCGQSTFEQSGYTFLQDMASSYNIPIFFSETGCQTIKPRTFDDQAAILGPDMDGTWSGAIIYEWIEEANDYGLISYGSPAAATATGSGVVAGYTRTGTPTPIQPDFDNLSSQWAAATPSGISMAAYNPTNSAPACPAFTSVSWLVSGDVTLPTLGAAVSHQGSSSSGSSTTGTSPSSGMASATSTGSQTNSAASATGSATSSETTGSATAASGSASASPSTAGASSLLERVALIQVCVGVMAVLLL